MYLKLAKIAHANFPSTEEFNEINRLVEAYKDPFKNHDLYYEALGIPALQGIRLPAERIQAEYGMGCRLFTEAWSNCITRTENLTDAQFRLMRKFYFLVRHSYRTLTNPTKKQEYDKEDAPASSIIDGSWKSFFGFTDYYDLTDWMNYYLETHDNSLDDSTQPTIVEQAHRNQFGKVIKGHLYLLLSRGAPLNFQMISSFIAVMVKTGNYY